MLKYLYTEMTYTTLNNHHHKIKEKKDQKKDLLILKDKFTKQLKTAV